MIAKPNPFHLTEYRWKRANFIQCHAANALMVAWLHSTAPGFWGGACLINTDLRMPADFGVWANSFTDSIDGRSC